MSKFANTFGWLLQRYVEESLRPGSRAIGDSTGYLIRAIQRAPLAAIQVAEVKPVDFMDYCKARKATGVLPQTINHDITIISTALKYASDMWESKEADHGILMLKKAKGRLTQEQLIGKSVPRERRPEEDEWARVKAYYTEQAKRAMTKIPMLEICEFQVDSARRRGETCKLRWSDVDFEKRICMVRDLKNPRGKGYHDWFPLLGRAWEIVQARRTLWDGVSPAARIFPYLPGSITASWIQMCKTLGIVGLRLHDLRREAVSRMFEQGFNVPEAAKLSLHRNPAILLRNYTALRAEDLHRGPAAKRA